MSNGRGDLDALESRLRSFAPAWPRPGPHRHHVPLDRLPEADAGVEAGGDDVGQPVVDDDLDRDGRMVDQEPGKRRREDGVGGVG